MDKKTKEMIEALIKEWFRQQKTKYPNSNYFEQLEMVEFHMFNDFCKSDNLKNVLEKD